MDKFFPENHREKLEKQIFEKLQKEDEKRKSSNFSKFPKYQDNDELTQEKKEYEESLKIDIFYQYKDVNGFKPSMKMLEDKTISELETLSDTLNTLNNESMARDKAEKEMYNELLERSKKDSSIQAFNNPEFEKFPHEFPGHYEKVFQKKEEIKNSLEDAFLKAKQRKKKKLKI